MRTNCLKKDQVKTFVENFLSSKSVIIYLKEIKQPDKWQEVIQNNGEYTIDWNSFIHEYFPKMRII